ncbi:MAG: hypothetical protein RIR97_464 [Pseudomonadota bacterium]
MTLQSMTGFSRHEGSSGRTRWVWELRSVNGKGLDLRTKLPSGFEHAETTFRQLCARHFTRGNLQISLTTSVTEMALEAVVNDAALNAILALKQRLGSHIDPAPLKLDTLLLMRGVIDLKEVENNPEDAGAREKDLMTGFEHAALALKSMRESEGLALLAVLSSQLDTIESLTAHVEADPSRSPQDIARKLQVQIATLLDAAPSLQQDRLYAEAAILATKADLREEIDRLKAHVAASRDLLAKGGPIGRKLDFLAQEFNREANTLCAKSNSTAVTAAGMELKLVIDQFREQVQNLE